MKSHLVYVMFYIITNFKFFSCMPIHTKIATLLLSFLIFFIFLFTIDYINVPYVEEFLYFFLGIYI